MTIINEDVYDQLKSRYPDFKYEDCSQIQLAVLNTFFNDFLLSYSQQINKPTSFKLKIDLHIYDNVLTINFVRRRDNKIDFDFMAIVDQDGIFDGLLSMSDFYYEAVYGNANVHLQLIRPFLMCKVLRINFKRVNQRVSFSGKYMDNDTQFSKIYTNLKDKEKIVYTLIQNIGLNIEKEFKYDKNLSFIFYRYKCKYENFYFDILSNQGSDSNTYEAVAQIYPSQNKNISLAICDLLNSSRQSADNLTIDDISVALMLEV
jgi:hypothetical protein